MEADAVGSAWAHNEHMDEVAEWLDQLPDELSAQQQLLRRFLDWGQRDEDVRWIQLAAPWSVGMPIGCRTSTSRSASG